MKLHLLFALGVLTASSSWPVFAAETGSAMAAEPRTVSGSIRSDGSVASGSGFTAQRINPGQYVITFTPRFKETPAVVGSQNNFGSSGEATTDTIVFPWVDATGAVALTGNNAGNQQNRSFAFFARGL